ncbi:TetR/AcrR family transcriptional regulator [Variovorax sp. DT-64]|uniref:TetR/AcrR family transcriptional regulator n=1 Tax=Variovorax sp. DT-64 TaxID=3396160 RepID=UPI003F1D5A3E
MKEARERRSREDVVLQLRDVFRRFGYEGATLSRISDVTGLGRASLYHHFPNGKDEMIKAVLEKTEETFDREILGRLRAELSPEERIRNVLDHFWTHYSGGSTTCFLALLALTSNEGDLGAGIQRVFRKWVTGFADVIREAGVPSDIADVRAEDAVLRIQGALVLATAINDPAPFQRVMLMLNDSLLANDAGAN